jgi:hypothetical protein
MPSHNRRRYLAIGAVAFLLIVGFILVSWRNRSSQWSVELDDGTTLTILDVATAPNEAIYVGASWKRPFAETFKGVGHNFKKNFGHLSVTNESAITWQWSGNKRECLALNSWPIESGWWTQPGKNIRLSRIYFSLPHLHQLMERSAVYSC